MTHKHFGTLLLALVCLILFLSCTNRKNHQTEQKSETVELPADGIVIEGIWAGPGRENGVSAVYMDILNGSSEADTILSLLSPAAGLVELHETFEKEEGMMGMRQAENTVISARSILTLKPGGMHIMLMQLNRELTEGSEVELTLQFAGAGEVVVNAPVRSAMQE